MLRSVSSKLAARALVLGVTAAVALIGTELSSREVQVGGPAFARVQAANDLRADVLPPPLFLIEAEHARPGDIEGLREAFEASAERWTASPIPGLDEAALRDVVTSGRAWFADYDHLVPALRSGDPEAAAAATAQLERAHVVHRHAVDRLVEAVEQARAATLADVDAEVTWLTLARMLALGLAGAAVLGEFAFFARRLGRRLASLADAVGTWTPGAELPGELRSGDEIGQVADAFHRTASRQSSTMQRLSRFAGELTSESTKLAQTSGRMGHGVEETAARMQWFANGAGDVTRSVQSLATAVDQMTEAITSVARSASQAARVAGSGVEAAREVEGTVARLERSSDEIGGISKLITNIAEQTNLLALNATIEAARAGEAGKGFAIVASEVKELAKATQSATENIAEKIEGIRSDVRNTTDAITKINLLIQEISTLQTAIASAVEEQTATTAQIGATLASVADAAAQMSGASESVAMSTSESAQTVRSTEQAAQTLSALAISVGRLALASSQTMDDDASDDEGVPDVIRASGRRAA